MAISLFNRVENIVEKEENADYQHFIHFCQFFPNPFFLGLLKKGFCGKE